MLRGTRRSLLLVLCIIILCGLLGVGFSQMRTSAATAQSADSDVNDGLRQFSAVYDLLEQNYAKPVNPDKAIYSGSIPGMLHVLDPHSNFFNPKSYSLIPQHNQRNYSVVC